MTDDLAPLPDLPDGVRARFIDGINGLRMHVLEAGEPDRPLLLLLHGFPELAYSWRKVMPTLAAAGYWVVAPDQRGYGRTTGWDGDYDGDLASFRFFNLVRDEGLCVGGSSGINIAGAIRLAKKLGPGHTIVTILADSGTRYLSKLFDPPFLKSKGLPIPEWLDK